MTDIVSIPTVETPDAPTMTPLRRRLCYLAATITLAAIIAAYASLARPSPLTPMEERLVGTWVSAKTGKDVTQLTFFPDRTCRRVYNPGPSADVWPFRWKIENGRIYARQGFRGWDKVINAITNLTILTPDIEIFSIRFISNDEMELGAGSFIRQNAVVPDR